MYVIIVALTKKRNEVTKSQKIAFIYKTVHSAIQGWNYRLVIDGVILYFLFIEYRIVFTFSFHYRMYSSTFFFNFFLIL